MKKSYRILVFCGAMLLSVGLSGRTPQERERVFREKFPYRYEITLGWAGYPWLDYFCLGSWGLNESRYSEPDYWYSASSRDEYMSGIISADFSIHYRRWFSLDVAMGMNVVWGKEYDAFTGDYLRPRSGAMFSLVPEAKFFYVNTKAFRLYSSVGLGLALGAVNREWTCYPVIQVTPIGLTAGRKVFFFAEASIGSAYIGGKTGIGYRF